VQGDVDPDSNGDGGADEHPDSHALADIYPVSDSDLDRHRFRHANADSNAPQHVDEPVVPRGFNGQRIDGQRDDDVAE
jgi:hypothetical protein